jgi:hypothetical protein
MFEITTSDGRGGRVERFDLHALPIGDTFAHKLNQGDLHKELLSRDVPNIAANMGWQQLAIAYARHLKATTPDPLTGKLPEVQP